MHSSRECAHFRALREPVPPRAGRSEECWAGRVLRVCLTYGHVGRCDSHNGHATAHHDGTGHELIRAWKGGAFVYCYADGRYV